MIVGLKCGLGTQSLGLDWPLSEVVTGLYQQICSIPHRLICACLPGTDNKKKSLRETPVDASRKSRQWRGAFLLRPSKHNQSKYYQSHRFGGKLSYVGTLDREPGAGHCPEVSRKAVYFRRTDDGCKPWTVN